MNIYNINFDIPVFSDWDNNFFKIDLWNRVIHVEQEDTNTNILFIGSPIANNGRQPLIYVARRFCVRREFVASSKIVVLTMT